MSKRLSPTAIFLLLIGFGIALSDAREPCDPCTGKTIWLIIINDTDYHADLSPSSATEDTSCCPDCLTPEEHYAFPDTLPYPKTIDSLLAIADGDGSNPDSMTATDWLHSDSVTGTEIQIPPYYTTCCCTNGVYWKARMWDAATSTWSAWTDVHVTEQGNTYFFSYLIALINTGGFKEPDLSGDMVFDCDVDSVVVYVWDTEDEIGGDGTRGEFGISARTWPDPATIGGALMDTVWLQRYDPSGLGIDDNEHKLPVDYFISQNSPNPFNATTAIQYGIPEDAEVHVEITNILGQKVATLVDEHQTAGYKRLIWNGRDDMGRELSSGVYFYSIKANGFMDKKRAILMK